MTLLFAGKMNRKQKPIIILALFALMSVFLSTSAFGQTADTLSYESTAQQEAQATQEVKPPALSNESATQQNGQATEEIQLPVIDRGSAAQQEDITSLARTGNLADAITILQLYKDTTGLSKTPLILIHGIHGSYDWTQNGIISPSYASYDKNGQYYWANFISYFDDDAGLNSKYKVYIFSYLSDRYSVKEIAKSLKNHIDSEISSGWMKDGKIVLLAHSMGGLVARSYMNEHGGGERVEKLITLATPHHGTPAANELAREYISTDIWWSSAMGIADLAYWGSSSTGPGWHPDLPNRSDLRWDNYDDRMSGGTCWSWDYAAYVDCYNNSLERNTWVQGLNKTTSYDSNVIAYYGYIYLNDPLRTSLIAQINDPLITIYDVLIQYKNADEHSKSRVVNILMSEGMNNYYLYNDGLVPSGSAEFNLHTVANSRECAGYDHLDMKDGNTTVCSTGKNLFESVKDDLYALITSPVYRFASNHDHFFTISEGEKNSIMQNLPNYHYEGIAFYTYPSQLSGTSPVYRFASDHDHFFTINEGEKNSIIQNLPNYHYEGIAFYAYSSQLSGTSPVYRFVSDHDHFFTISEGEKNSIMQNLPSYHYEGVAFYAYPTQ